MRIHPGFRLTAWSWRCRGRPSASASPALGVFGFGVSGFDRRVREHGETILEFSVNPLRNVVQAVIGLGLLLVVCRSRWAVPGAVAALLPCLMLRVVGPSSGIDLLAMK